MNQDFIGSIDAAGYVFTLLLVGFILMIEWGVLYAIFDFFSSG